MDISGKDTPNDHFLGSFGDNEDAVSKKGEGITSVNIGEKVLNLSQTQEIISPQYIPVGSALLI